MFLGDGHQGGGVASSRPLTGAAPNSPMLRGKSQRKKEEPVASSNSSLKPLVSSQAFACGPETAIMAKLCIEQSP